MSEQTDIALFCDIQSVHFKKWRDALTERGYKLQVFSPYGDGQSEPNQQVYTTPKSPLPLPASIKTFGKTLLRARNGRMIRDQLKPNPPKLVHAHFLLDSGWMAAQLGMHPFVVTAHGSDLLVLPRQFRLYRYVARQVLQRCDRVIIVSEHLREPLKSYGVPEHKIRQVPSFIDTGRFSPDGRKPRADRIVIGSARSFAPIYDVETLLRAAPLILEQFPNIEVHLAGDGVQKPYLQNLATDLGIQDKVKFLGFLNQEQIADFFRKLDICVTTALSDGLSVTLLEAAACGAFPVATDIPGNRSTFQFAIEGMLFKPRDPQHLAENIKAALGNPDKTFEASQRNAEAVSRLFNKQAVVDKMQEVYQELLN